jgi:hypothetical protein
MKLNQPLYLLFILLPLLANANIWDNIFLGQGLTFKLPKDFWMELSLNQPLGKLKFQIVGSSSLNSVSIIQGADINPIMNLITSDLLDYIFNFTNGTLFIHSPLKQCVAIQDEKLEIDFYSKVQGYIDLATLLISKEEDGEYLKLSAKSLVHMVNSPGDLPDIAFYFDSKTENLKKIEFSIPNYPSYMLDVTRLDEYYPSYDEFTVPNSWSCEKEKLQKLDEIDAEDLYDEVKNSNSTSALLKLLKLSLGDIKIPELPDLPKKP